jgi:hypothetical protein
MKEEIVIYLHGYATRGGLKEVKARFFQNKFSAYDHIDFHAMDFNPTAKDFQLGHMSSCQLPALDAIAKHIDEYHSEPLLRLPNGRLGWLKKGSEGSAQPNLVAHSFPWSCANRSGW